MNKKSPKVILLASVDFANLGFLYNESLKSVGIDSKLLISKHHKFGYENQGIVCDLNKMKEYVKEADIVQFMHSEYFDVGNLENKRVFVVHGGSRYRQNPEKFNRIFNPIVEKTIIQTGDLLNLGSKNEVWILPSVDTEYIKPVYNTGDQIIISHFPSDSKTKGTEIINKKMRNIRKMFGRKINYVFSPKPIPWTKNIERISKCDIYIEMLKKKQRNKKYGSWGVTCLEAAALGKIVVTNFLNLKRYEIEYGKCPLIVANSGKDLELVLKKIIKMNSDDLFRIKKQTREWVENLHSYKSIGKRLKKKVYNL